MSEQSTNKITINLGKVALGLGVITGIGGLVTAAVLIPHRLSQVEARVESLQLQQQRDHELLSRIDERTGRYFGKTGTTLYEPHLPSVRTAEHPIKTSYIESYEVDFTR